MVKFVVSPAIQAIIEEYNAVNNVCEQDDGYISPTSASIEHLQLAHMISSLPSNYSLHDVLKSTSLYLEPSKKRELVYLPYIVFT